MLVTLASRHVGMPFLSTKGVNRSNDFEVFETRIAEESGHGHYSCSDTSPTDVFTVDALLKMSLESMKLKPGDVLECVADCPAFEADVKEWCKHSKKALHWFKTEAGSTKRCQVRI